MKHETCMESLYMVLFCEFFRNAILNHFGGTRVENQVLQALPI